MPKLETLNDLGRREQMSIHQIAELTMKIGRRQQSWEVQAKAIETKHGMGISFGKVLKSLRLRHVWTQTRVAYECEVNREAVSMWESDSRMPSGDSMIALLVLIPELAVTIKTIWPTAYDWTDFLRIKKGEEA